MSFGQAVSDEARRHFVRGLAAVEMAKSLDDYNAAINEFEQATNLAPDWAEAWFNLGKVQEKAGKFREAAASLNKFLKLTPDDPDAANVKDQIYKLEYKRDTEKGVSKVLELMQIGPDRLRWSRICLKGDNETDWEIEQTNNQAVYEMNNGIFYKKLYFCHKGNTLINVNRINGNWDSDRLAVKINGRLIEYNYRLMKHFMNSKSIATAEEEGEISINTEIISFDPPRIKKVQQVNWSDGRTSLTEFVYELVEGIYLADGQEINSWDENGITPLSHFIIINRKDLAELMITKGADINSKNRNGSRPLHEAAEFNRTEMAELLIANGADLNAKDNNGNSPLHMAVEAVGEKKRVDELLIDRGADINAKNNDSETPLHRAAICGRKKAALLLISKGAEINAKNNKGDTPLQYARFLKEMADLLRKCGASEK